MEAIITYPSIVDPQAHGDTNAQVHSHPISSIFLPLHPWMWTHTHTHTRASMPTHMQSQHKTPASQLRTYTVLALSPLAQPNTYSRLLFSQPSPPMEVTTVAFQETLPELTEATTEGNTDEVIQHFTCTDKLGLLDHSCPSPASRKSPPGSGFGIPGDPTSPLSMVAYGLKL